MPELRFPEFSGEWEEVVLNDLVKNNNDIVAGPFGSNLKVKDYVDDGIPIIRLQNVERNKFVEKDIKYTSHEKAKELKYHSYKPGDIIFAKLGNPLGKTCIVPSEFESGLIVADVVRIRLFRDIVNTNFITNILNSQVLFKQIHKETIGSTRLRVNISQVRNFKFFIPNLSEQEKIASFLSKVDEKIEKLEKKQKVWETYKKGMMQKILSQELRFKDENGEDYPDWEERKFSDILFEHKEKSTGKEEVYSVSVHKGLINQVEHLGRTFAAKDTSKYNLVKPGDIVYTKSPTGDFPLGIIKQSKVSMDVLVSPLYGVFSPETKYLGTILDAHFESSINTKNYLHPIVQKGAKNTMNISNSTFLSRGFVLPISIEEQEIIANFIANINHKISLINKKLNLTTEFKKGLLQKMFC